MHVLRGWTVPLTVLFIHGCSSGKTPEPAPAPPAKTVFDPMLQPLGRAKDVQNTVDQNADATRKHIDAEERGDSPP